MYQADGIDLTRTEFAILKQAEDSTEPLPGKTLDAYKRLHDCGLAEYWADYQGFVYEVDITPRGRDWLASYRRGRNMKAASAWYGALAGGIVSLAVTLLLHFAFGL